MKLGEIMAFYTMISILDTRRGSRYVSDTGVLLLLGFLILITDLNTTQIRIISLSLKHNR